MTTRRRADPRRTPKLDFAAMFPPRTDGLCRCGCGEKLEGRQRSWRPGHDAGPVEQFKIARGDSSAIRTAVFRRDKGICQGCRLDVPAAAKLCSRWGLYHHTSAEENQRLRQEAEAARATYMALGYPSPMPDGSNWIQIDHIRPLWNGGANELPNFQSLCTVCHKAKSKAEAGQRAGARRAAGEAKSQQGRLAFLPITAPEEKE